MKKLIRKQKNKIAQRSIWFWGFSAIFMAFLGVLAYFLFSFTQSAVFSQKNTLAAPIIIQPTSTSIPPFSENEINLMQPLQAAAGPSPRPWDGQSRVNILFLGLDSPTIDSGSTQKRTDALLLVTVDPQLRRAGMLSIPRDLWVKIPNIGYQQISRAYEIGEVNNTPGGGVGLVIASLENLFEIQISFYALIDYQTFSRLIDEIEGVKLELPEAIRVAPIGDHNTKTLQPGIQTLPGDLALAYVRALDDSDSDFKRMLRQQNFLLQIPKRIIEFDIFAQLVAKAPSVYLEIASGLATNLNLEQIFQFIWLATRISAEAVSQEIIGPGQVTLATSATGETILRPIPEEIFGLRDRFFYDKTAIAPSIVDPLSELGIIEENAAIDLRNGTQTPGLAAKTEAYLLTENIVINTVSNAEKIYANSVIIDYTGKPYTVRTLARLLNVPQGQIFYRLDPDQDADILILLGSDWAANNLLP